MEKTYRFLCFKEETISYKGYVEIVAKNKAQAIRKIEQTSQDELLEDSFNWTPTEDEVAINIDVDTASSHIIE